MGNRNSAVGRTMGSVPGEPLVRKLREGADQVNLDVGKSACPQHTFRGRIFKGRMPTQLPPAVYLGCERSMAPLSNNGAASMFSASISVASRSTAARIMACSHCGNRMKRSVNVR